MTLTTNDYASLAQLLDAEVAGDGASWYRPRYNVAPTDKHPILRLEKGERRLQPASWGFTTRRVPLLINARAESLATRTTFRDALRKRRCIVPADGFFEWTGKGGKRRPIWYHPKDGGLLRMAGLWEARPDGHLAFVVITTQANDLVSPVHDRMPVILREDGVDEWLARPSGDLLVPVAPDYLVATPVSRRVNSVENDDPSCLAPQEAEDDPDTRQGKLF